MEKPECLCEAYACSVQIVEDFQEKMEPAKMNPKDWAKTQTLDLTLAAIKKMMTTKSLFRMKVTPGDPLGLRTYLHQKGRLRLRNDILYRYMEDWSRTDRNSMQLCLSKALRKEFFEACHFNVGHLGLERTVDLLRDLLTTLVG